MTKVNIIIIFFLVLPFILYEINNFFAENNKKLKIIKTMSIIAISCSVFLIFFELILAIINNQGLSYLDNHNTYLMPLIIVAFFNGYVYFKAKRKNDIENNVITRLNNDKINKNSLIKCDNVSRFLFLKCNYIGIPTKKIPMIEKIIFFLDNGWHLVDSIGIFERWDKYKLGGHWFCPICGEELYNKNLAEK